MLYDKVHIIVLHFFIITCCFEELCYLYPIVKQGWHMYLVITCTCICDSVVLVIMTTFSYSYSKMN